MRGPGEGLQFVDVPVGGQLLPEDLAAIGVKRQVAYDFHRGAIVMTEQNPQGDIPDVLLRGPDTQVLYAEADKLLRSTYQAVGDVAPDLKLCSVLPRPCLNGDCDRGCVAVANDEV